MRYLIDSNLFLSAAKDHPAVVFLDSAIESDDFRAIKELQVINPFQP